MNNTGITAFGAATYNQTDNLPMKLEDYLLAVMGPKQMDDHLVLILVTVFYMIIFISGIVGNLSVCLVIIKSKQLHSAMNYYLVSLALADLTIIVLGELNNYETSSIVRPIAGVPNELSIYWHQYPYPFGEAFCRVRSFLSER